MAGLGIPSLRHPNANTQMTAAEFKYLKQHPEECPEHMRALFEHSLKAERRSEAAKKVVATKRAKYKEWPTRKRTQR